MKIEALRLIEEALVGGRNGEMAYIENNPLIASLFREYMNETGKDFKSFLFYCLDDEYLNKNEITKYKYEDIEKSYNLDKNDIDYKEYKEIESKINILIRKKNEKLKEIAHKLNPHLAEVSTFEIKYREYGQDLQFKINVMLIEDSLTKK